MLQISVALGAAIALASLLGLMARSWWKYRGARVITCPGNLRPAKVSVDAGHLAARPFAGTAALRLSSCTRWPDHAGCGQECLSQVAADPHDCLVRTILVKWYDGKRCASCGEPFGQIPLAGVKPAVLGADAVSVEWSEIPADRLPETLAAGLPICFACHIGNMLDRNQPELAVDRHRAADRGSK
jgi:hypothetical protein